MFIRNCPTCGTEISYTMKVNLFIANKRGSDCLSCASRKRRIGKHHSEKTKQKMAKSMSVNHADVSGKNNPMYQKGYLISGRNNGMFGKYGAMLGKHHSDESRKKIARGVRKYRLGKVTPAYNPIACRLIEEYGKKHGYHFQHAENGGEVRVIGYSLDGYDAEKNVVIEVYELRHKYTMEHDEQRKKEIINEIGCKFIEIKEWEL